MDLVLSASIGIPGSLTIDIAAAQRLIAGKRANLIAPLSQALLGSGPTGTATGDAAQPAAGFIANAWGKGWATPLTQRAIALGGNTKYQLLELLCPSLDVTDMAWGMTGSIDATSDPASITAVPFGTGSIYGRTFQEGDYVLWDDPSVADGKYQYEIDQIVTVRGNNFTFARNGGTSGGGTAGGAQFGSVKAAHAACNFYRLVGKVFTVLWAGEEQTFKFLWDNMIVAAISATTPGLDSPTVLNLFPVPPAAASPGLAT